VFVVDDSSRGGCDVGDGISDETSPGEGEGTGS
jgi:hypothetical protein